MSFKSIEPDSNLFNTENIISRKTKATRLVDKKLTEAY